MQSIFACFCEKHQILHCILVLLHSIYFIFSLYLIDYFVITFIPLCCHILQIVCTAICFGTQSELIEFLSTWYYKIAFLSAVIRVWQHKPFSSFCCLDHLWHLCSLLYQTELSESVLGSHPSKPACFFVSPPQPITCTRNAWHSAKKCLPASTRLC